MQFCSLATKQYMEVGGCHSAEKITAEGQVSDFGTDVFHYINKSVSIFFSAYLHGMFELVGIVLGWRFQQSKHHVLQIAFQSILQSPIQRL